MADHPDPPHGTPPPPPGGDRAGTGEPALEPAAAPGQVPQREREFVGTGPFWGLVVGLVVAVVVIVFSGQNTAQVEVEFLGWEWTWPLFAVILAAMLAGIVLDEIIGLLFRSRRRRRLAEREELKRLRKQSGR